jgi:cytoskeleton protein RodZ
MASVAEQLRTAREAQKLTIQQIAGITNVRADHIRAIEEGNYDVFSAPVYIRGFVRSYAKILKLDVPSIIAAVDAELGQTEKFSEPPPLTDEPRTIVDWVTLQLSKIDWRKALIAAAVLLVGLVIYGIVSTMMSGRKADGASGVKPAVYRPTTNRPGDTLQLPPPARRP